MKGERSSHPGQSGNMDPGVLSKVAFSLDMDPPTATAQQKRVVRGTDCFGKKIFIFKKDSVKKAESLLYYALYPYRPKHPMKGAVELWVKWCFGFNSSHTKTLQKQGEIRNLKRPDLSNLVKILEDTMTQVGFWVDDSQIFQLHLSKWNSNEPKIEIKIHEYQIT